MPPFSLPARLLSALPDAVTAAVFLSIWIDPLGFGPNGVRNAMLMLLVEFILLHASGMIGGFLLVPNVRLVKRLAGLFGFGVFYLGFVGVFVIAFEQWWPLLAFAWLLLGKFGRLLLLPTSNAESQRQLGMWAMSGFFYIVGLILTVLLPLPRLGISADLSLNLGLTGSGLWVDAPHTMVAFGVLYFSALAMVKFTDRGV